jgi:hypothetical protein
MEEMAKLEKEARQKAWEMATDKIKDLLIKLFENQEGGSRWLIYPNWRFKNGSPVEIIIEGDSARVENVLEIMISDIYD